MFRVGVEFSLNTLTSQSLYQWSNQAPFLTQCVFLLKFPLEGNTHVRASLLKLPSQYVDVDVGNLNARQKTVKFSITDFTSSFPFSKVVSFCVVGFLQHRKCVTKQFQCYVTKNYRSVNTIYETIVFKCPHSTIDKIFILQKSHTREHMKCKCQLRIECVRVHGTIFRI